MVAVVTVVTVVTVVVVVEVVVVVLLAASWTGPRSSVCAVTVFRAVGDEVPNAPKRMIPSMSSEVNVL